HFKIWLKNDFFPNVESRSLLLIDSWTGHCPDTVKSVKPSDKEVGVVIIPKGRTENIQSSDVGYTVVKPDTFDDSVKFALGMIVSRTAIFRNVRILLLFVVHGA
ncbi:hypothetical protein PV325_009581, partial [Microctonus aethiopoides]